MRTTLNLEDDVYEAAMTMSKASGQTLGQVVSELLRRELNRDNISYGEGELPVFPTPAQATLIPGSRASELLDDDHG